MTGLVTLADIQAAADRIAGRIVRTPLLPAPWADDKRPLWLKAESLQPTGAFKMRGAFSALSALDPEARARGVVAHSSGNHAQAVAWAARAYGVPAVIVMPNTTPEVKMSATRALGAEIVVVPPAERDTKAFEIADERELTLVAPYDDPQVIAGQGTAGLEIATDLPDVDVVLVPVSGGGLISGIAVALKSLVPAARVIGVEPELVGKASESLRRGERVVRTPEQTYRTIADGLRTTALGVLNWAHIQKYVDDIVTVSEDEIRQGMTALARRSRLVAEPSGAVTTAAYLFHADQLPSGRTVAVVSGGNVDPALLASVLTS